MRMFSGYKVLYRVGAGADQTFGADREAGYHALAGCVMCFPVLRSTGEFHACPFAVESAAPHYRLGDLDTAPAEVFSNYRRFRTWARTVLDPAARGAGPLELRDVPPPRPGPPHLSRRPLTAA